MTEIIPALLPKDVKELEYELSLLPKEVECVHLDVLEEDVYSPIGSDYEAHLMVTDPLSKAPLYIERGAKRIITHKLEGFEQFKGKVEVGLGVELDVPLENIFPLVAQVDFVHLMSIAEIGAQGHPFDIRIYERIKTMREKFPELVISVDGGVNQENMHSLIEAGADRLIVGSAIFKGDGKVV